MIEQDKVSEYCPHCDRYTDLIYKSQPPEKRWNWSQGLKTPFVSCSQRLEWFGGSLSLLGAQDDGILIALGAERASILKIFLFENRLLALPGGVLGPISGLFWLGDLIATFGPSPSFGGLPLLRPPAPAGPLHHPLSPSPQLPGRAPRRSGPPASIPSRRSDRSNGVQRASIKERPFTL